MYLLGVDYARSRAGERARANGAGKSNGTPDPESVDRQKAFLAAHRPIWLWLLEHAEVVLACDRHDPDSIWGWALTSGPTVVHAVGCKRDIVDLGFAKDITRDLLGERLTQHQVCTLELPRLRTKAHHAIGIDRPREWSLDPTWLLVRMVGR